MTTTLTQQYTRARSTEFRQLIEAALDEVLPDVIGEQAGASVPTQGGGTVVLTATMVTKRYALAMSILGSAERRAHWVATFAALAGGETVVKNIDVPALPSDAQVKTTIQRLFQDCAGVQFGD